MDALDATWARRLAGGDTGYEAAREEVKNFAWAPGGFPAVRAAAIDYLLGDERDAGGADTRSMIRLMLPTERNEAVRDYLCAAAAQRGWKDLTPAIVRAWSVPNQNVPDTRRPEYLALQQLHGSGQVERAVWEVFATPAPDASGAELDRATRARSAAWEVLSRLDPDGSKRAAWLGDGRGPSGGGDATVQAAAACARDLRCVPVTSDQLEWVVSLAGDRAWWEQTSRAAAGLSTEQAQGLALRNLEALRWASLNRPEWLRLDRNALLGALRERVNARTRHPRSAEAASNTVQGSELLSDNAPRMTWGDVLSVLVIDHAVRTPGVGEQWWSQIERDHADISTEYGGVLETLDSGGGGAGFRTVLYPPRPTQRFSDDRFVASQDMLGHGARALAHYHFHAKDVPNRAYAGPGGGDMMYAATLGRACLVVTPIAPGVVNVDYYHAVAGPGGDEVRVDLGEVRAGE